MSRRYVKITPEQLAQAAIWFETREWVGNQKQAAARIGISVERLQAIVAKIRRERGRVANLARARSGEFKS